MSGMGVALKYIKGDLKSINQLVARLEQDARQPRRAMEADRPADVKTRERTKGAAKVVQAKHGDGCTVHNRFKTDRRPRPVSA